MGKTLFTSKGAAVEIGRELGRGGEGTVFEVPSLGSQVAKLYHHHLDARKQAKLTYMAATADEQLLSYLAWPQETLHPSRGGPVVGFLMPKVAGKEPIHMVYGPARRRQEYPKAAWDFLLFVARNIAACFETAHRHGHVVGDVNQDSVMAGRDSKVMMVDSDSFQVNARGTMYLCEVGVAHYTPPELQTLPSFNGFTRTTNHDNFGLALLIFHVLFGGRHPYSGVPQKSGVGAALQTDIRNFCYAYAKDNQSRGIAPPPRSIPVSMVPESMELMFHAAFTERGAQGHRPTAEQWVAALDGLRGDLRRCGASPMHVYPNHLSKCPWCALENEGVTYFVDLGTPFMQTASGFVLTQVWTAIQAVPPPPPLAFPSPSDFQVAAQPLPPGVPGEGNAGFFRALAVGLGILIVVGFPGNTFWGFVVAVVGWLLAGSSDSPERAAEKARRSASLQAAKRNYDQLVETAKKEVGSAGFHAARERLAKLRDEYQALSQTEKQELDSLHSTARTRQKRKFLEQFFIESATIPGVGPARKATLRSFGIETAADVSMSKLMHIHGFGSVLTGAIADWRLSCERRFVFNASTAVTAADQAQVRVRFGARKVQLEAELIRAPKELSTFGQRAAGRLVALRSQLETSAKNLAQAEKDLSAL